MFSFFKKKKIVPHIKLSGVIGSVGKFKQGIDFSGQEEIISKAFSIPSTSGIRTVYGCVNPKTCSFKYLLYLSEEIETVCLLLTIQTPIFSN